MKEINPESPMVLNMIEALPVEAISAIFQVFLEQCKPSIEFATDDECQINELANVVKFMQDKLDDVWKQLDSRELAYAFQYEGPGFAISFELLGDGLDVLAKHWLEYHMDETLSSKLLDVLLEGESVDSDLVFTTVNAGTVFSDLFEIEYYDDDSEVEYPDDEDPSEENPGDDEDEEYEPLVYDLGEESYLHGASCDCEICSESRYFLGESSCLIYEMIEGYVIEMKGKKAVACATGSGPIPVIKDMVGILLGLRNAKENEWKELHEGEWFRKIKKKL